MNDTVLFFVPADLKYTFDDVIDELSCTYCTVNNWNIHNQDETGWWYAVHIIWDTELNDTVMRLQRSLFFNSAYIYVGHRVSKNKTVYYDVTIFCPRIYDYPNLYKQHMELLQTHSDVTAELNRVKEINADLDRDNVELKTKMEKMKKEEKNKCEQIEYYKLKTAKFDIKCKKYKESKQHIRELKEEQGRLHKRNQELFERYPQHC